MVIHRGFFVGINYFEEKKDKNRFFFPDIVL